MGDPVTQAVSEDVIAKILTERQMRKTERSPDGHLLWKGGLANGHPAVKHNGKTVYLRRLLWEEVYGPIPEGSVVTSSCRVRTCIEPSHLTLTGPGRYPRARGALGRCQVERDASRSVGPVVSKETQVA